MNVVDPVFHIEPELLEPVPRRVVPTRRTNVWWRFCWNLLLAIVCVVYYFGSAELGELTDLAHHGRLINGYVAAATPTANNADNPGWDIYYSYKRGSIGKDGSFAVPDWNAGPPQRGDAFQVTYLPASPSVYRIGTVTGNMIATCRDHWFAVGLMWTAPLAFGMWIMYCHGTNRRRLLQHGIATVATVTFRRIVKTAETTGQYLTYSYTLADGGIRTKEKSVSESIYNAYPEGSQFSVLVSDTDVFRSEPYFSFTNVRLVNAPVRSFP